MDMQAMLKDFEILDRFSIQEGYTPIDNMALRMLHEMVMNGIEQPLGPAIVDKETYRFLSGKIDDSLICMSEFCSSPVWALPAAKMLRDNMSYLQRMRDIYAEDVHQTEPLSTYQPW
jgi:hypothetical protein